MSPKKSSCFLHLTYEKKKIKKVETNKLVKVAKPKKEKALTLMIIEKYILLYSFENASNHDDFSEKTSNTDP